MQTIHSSTLTDLHKDGDDEHHSEAPTETLPCDNADQNDDCSAKVKLTHIALLPVETCMLYFS